MLLLLLLSRVQIYIRSTPGPGTLLFFFLSLLQRSIVIVILGPLPTTCTLPSIFGHHSSRSLTSMLRIVLFILLFISLAVAAAKSSLTGRFVHVTGESILAVKAQNAQTNQKNVDFHLDPYYKPGTDVKHRCHRHEDDGKYGDDDDDDDSDSDEDDNDDEDDDDDKSLVPGPLGAVGTKCDSPPALVISCACVH